VPNEKIADLVNDEWGKLLTLFLELVHKYENIKIESGKLESRWRSIKQKEGEPLCDFLAREQDLFDVLQRALVFRGRPEVSDPDRVCQLVGSVRTSLERALTKKVVKEGWSVEEDLPYKKTVDLLRELEAKEDRYRDVPWRLSLNGDPINYKEKLPRETSSSTTSSPSSAPETKGNGVTSSSPNSGSSSTKGQKPSHGGNKTNNSTSNSRQWCDLHKWCKHNTTECRNVKPETPGEKSSKSPANVQVKKECDSSRHQDADDITATSIPDDNGQLFCPVANIAIRRRGSERIADNYEPTTIAIDSFSNKSLICSSMIHESWLVEKLTQPINLGGITGHQMLCTRMCLVPCLAEGKHFNFKCHIVDLSNLPFEFRLIMGARTMASVNATLDFPNMKLILTGLGLSFTLSYLQRPTPTDCLPSVSCTTTSEPELVTRDHLSSAEAFEERLSEMSDDEVRLFFKSRLAGWSPPNLSFDIDTNIPVQRHRAFHIPPGLRGALDAELKKMVERGEIKPVDYDPEAWISSGFCKEKSSSNGELRVRVLVNFAPLNEHISIPSHLKDGVSTIDEFLSSCRESYNYYWTADIEGAFHTVEADESCIKYLHVAFNGQIYAFLKMPQGLALSPYIWCSHIKECFHRLMMHHWRAWFGVYVDDNIGGRRTFEEAQQRLRIFKLACEVLGKTLSLKVDSSVKQSVTICGITFLPQSRWRLSDLNIQKLQTILSIEPATREWMRKLIGVLSYSRSLFSFGIDKCSGFGEQMAKLTECFKTRPYRLTDEAKSAIESFRHHFSISPRVAFGVDDLISSAQPGSSNSRLLAVTFDGSDTAVGGALFLVRLRSAETLTIQDLQDPVACTMIDAFSVVLNSSQRRWFTFEIESYGMYTCLIRWRRLFVAVCRDIPDPTLPARIVIFSDSTTALKHWDTASIPDCRIGSIKAKRFAGWQAEVAEYQYLPILFKFASGTTNIVADVFSRYETAPRASSLRTRPAGFRTSSNMEASTFPGSGPSEPDFDMDPTLIATDYGTPSIPLLGLPPPEEDHLGERNEDDSGIYFDLNINKEEAEILADAYRHDLTTEYHGIPVAYVYLYLFNDLPTDIKLPSMTLSRLRAWRDTRFTIRRLPNPEGSNGGTPLLYTPSPNRRSNPDRIVWVVVLPNGAEWPVNSPDRLVLVNAFHLNTISIEARQLLLAWTHDCQGHCGGGESAHQLWFVAWWPASLQDHMEFRNSCPSCLRRIIQSGINKAAALGPGEIDHIGTGATQFHLVESKISVTTARLIFCRWIPTYGRPLHLHADGGFNSQCYHEFAKLIGCRVERRNHFLSDAFSTEPITDDISLELAVATACIKANQISRSDGEHTAFEVCFGAPPNLLVEAIGDYCDSEGKSVSKEDDVDDEFINAIRRNVRETFGSVHAHADARSHYSLTGRVADQQRGRGLAQLFTAGQLVLVKGRDLEVPLSIMKIYSDDNGDARVIVLEDGSRVPGKDCFHPPAKRHYFCRAGGATHLELEIGDFVLFTKEESAGDGHVQAEETINYFVGKVIGFSDDDFEDKVTLHHHGHGGHKIVRFLPLWSKGSTITRRGEVKPGEEPLVDIILKKQVLCTLPLSNGCLNNECRSLMRSLGVDWFNEA
ncbi:hypothetical protein FOL47_009778, partial [Perkinsus chesapeaki]